jgi:hypothetical protein
MNTQKKGMRVARRIVELTDQDLAKIAGGQHIPTTTDPVGITTTTDPVGIVAGTQSTQQTPKP